MIGVASGGISPARATSTTFFVSKNSPLHLIELAAIEEAATAHAISPIAANDDLQAAFKKVRIAYALRVRASLEGDQTRIARLEVFIKESGAACERWPDSPELAMLHAYALLYGRSEETALRTILPSIQDAENVPGIPLLLHRIFYTIHMNYKLSLDHERTIPESIRFMEKLGWTSEIAMEKARLLAIYWHRRIDQENAGRLNISAYFGSAQDAGFTSREEAVSAFRAWSDVMQYTAGRNAVERQVEQQAAAAVIAAQRDEEEAKRRREAYEADQDKHFQQQIAALEELGRGAAELHAIEMRLASLQRYRDRLKRDHADIPNYEQLRQAFGDSEEAQVINLAYKLIVLEDATAVLKEAETLKTRDSDVRVLYLRAFSSLRLGDLSSAKRFVRRILELQPEDFRAKRTLLRIEELESKATTENPSLHD